MTRREPDQAELQVTRARDLQLAQDVLVGRGRALKVLTARMTCVPRILRVLARRMGMNLGEDELADLSQDVLVIIWRKLPTFEGRATLESWAFSICTWELRNCLRRRVRTSEREARDFDVLELEDEPVPAPENHDVLLRALEQLDPPAPDIIRRKVYDSATFDEIGRELEMSPNTAKTHYYRSLQKLRAQLGRSYQEEAT